DVAHRPHLVGRSARRPRSEHDARDDREQSPSQSGARGRDRVRRSSRAPRRLGTRGRAPARTLSSRSRSRARRRPRFPRVGDPARVLSGVLFGACGAVLVICVWGPYFRITDVSVSGTHHITVDAVTSTSALGGAAMKLAHLGTSDLRADATAPRVTLTKGADGLVIRVSAGWEIRFGGAERIDEKIALAKRFLRENPQRKLDYLDVRTPDSI